MIYLNMKRSFHKRVFQSCRRKIGKIMKNNNTAYDVILSPVVTEKSTNLNVLNKLTFKVSKNATKFDIKKSIEKLYKVEVIKINTILSKPKIKIVRGKLGKKTGYKKAIVTLKEGQTIDMTSGV